MLLIWHVVGTGEVNNWRGLTIGNKESLKFVSWWDKQSTLRNAISIY